MDSLKAQLESLKEKLKTAWLEQQERPWFIALKERYQELPPLAQTGLLYGIAGLILMVFLATPISSLMDASDQNSRFDGERQVLKELLRVQRDLASAPNIPIPPAPISLKGQMDMKITAAGVKPEQVKSSQETPAQVFQGTQQLGIEYKIEHLTVRQALDLGYELEHTDQGFKLESLDLLAEGANPHFYSTDFKIVSFNPRVADAGGESGAGGAGLVDAINRAKGTSAPPTNLPPPPQPRLAPKNTGPPVGNAPAIPGFRGNQ